ncbi:TPA: type I methionyl aminopeptidase, partial [Listeria monocytogenes]|nr:type I methionyl aminopeptidase [Listeria monocytogenes]
MITLKSRREIDEMKAAGKILADTHKELKKIIKPGITSWDLEVF